MYGGEVSLSNRFKKVIGLIPIDIEDDRFIKR